MTFEDSAPSKGDPLAKQVPGVGPFLTLSAVRREVRGQDGDPLVALINRVRLMMKSTGWSSGDYLDPYVNLLFAHVREGERIWSPCHAERAMFLRVANRFEKNLAHLANHCARRRAGDHHVDGSTAIRSHH